MSEIDRSLVGSLSEPFIVEIERGAIRRFVDAIGDPNPLYRDVDRARDAGYADLLAPPTFPASFRAPEDPPWIRTLDRRRIVAGETWFRHWRPVVAGMRLVCRTRFVGVEDKAGQRGSMALILQQLEARAIGAEVALADAPEADAPLVVVAGRTTVYRSLEQVEKRSLA